jgi:hypothetical protein
MAHTVTVSDRTFGQICANKWPAQLPVSSLR